MDTNKMRSDLLASAERAIAKNPPGGDGNPFPALAVRAVDVLALLAEIERLEGLTPGLPPRPPEGSGLPRYGLRWNGPGQPLAVPMEDGYWAPWHLAAQLKAESEALRTDAERYRWLRDAMNDVAITFGAHAWEDLSGEFMDQAIDAAMAKEASHD